MRSPRALDPLASAVSDAGALARGLAAPHASEEEREVLGLLLEQTRRLVSREVNADAIEASGRISKDLVGAFASAGLFGLTIPETYGGAGLSLKAACRIVDQIARTERSVAIMVGLHAGLGTRALVELGSDALKQRFLPALASGERVGSFAATEANAGSDLGAIKTTGTRVPGGIRLDGEKVYVTNGGFAGVYTVLASTPGIGGARAHSLVCIARETPGLRVGAEEHKLGIRASSTITLELDGAVVPEDQILGEPGKGIDQAHATLAWGRTIMAAGCVGTAHAALAATVSHVTSRRQFGKPIGEFPATRAHVADMAATVYAMESVVRWVGHALARGEALDVLSTTAKLFASEGAFEVCDTAVQLHGALGFIEPVGVARMLRDCRVTRIFEGANDVLLVRAGTALLALHAPLEKRLADAVAPELSHEARAWDQLASKLSAAVVAVKATHGVAVVRRQLVLQRLAKTSVALQAAAASLLRATASRDADELMLARHAAARLVREAERHLEDLERGADDESRALELTERLYRPDAAPTPETCS